MDNQERIIELASLEEVLLDLKTLGFSASVERIINEQLERIYQQSSNKKNVQGYKAERVKTIDAMRKKKKGITFSTKLSPHNFLAIRLNDRENTVIRRSIDAWINNDPLILWYFVYRYTDLNSLREIDSKAYEAVQLRQNVKKRKLAKEFKVMKPLELASDAWKPLEEVIKTQYPEIYAEKIRRKKQREATRTLKAALNTKLSPKALNTPVQLPARFKSLGVRDVQVS